MHPVRNTLGRSTALALVLLSFGGQAGAAVESDNDFLEMDLQQLMSITITTVSKKPQALGDAAAAIYVIGQEDIHRSGVTTIPDALALAPGLQVTRISSSKWSISSRGFTGYTSNKLLVLVDGRSVYSPAYSGTFWDMQHTVLEDIDRIEVIRGPGGTLWGANAVNGVINIITKKASDTLGGLVRASLGTNGQANSAARYGVRLGEQTAGRIYLSYDQLGSNQLHAGGGDGNDDWRTGQAGFRLDGSQGHHGQWTLQGDLFRNAEEQILFPFWQDHAPYLIAKYGDIDVQGGNLIGRWRQEFSGAQAFTLQAYYDYNDRQDDYYQQSFNTLDLELQYETALGSRHSVTLGSGYRNIQGSFSETFIVGLADRTDSLYSAFLQDEIRLVSDHLWLTLGTKYEHNDYTGSEWQPSARLLWKPRADQSVWASVAQAVRTPSMVESDGRVLAAAYPTATGLMTSSFYGNQDFDAEKVLAYEAGFRWQVRRNLSVDLAAFYNRYRDLYTLTPDASRGGYDFTFTNTVEGESHGIEAILEWQPASSWNLSLGYAYLYMDLDPAQEGSTWASKDFISLASPRHTLSLRSSYQVTPRLQFNLWGRYVDTIVCRSSLDLIGTTVPLDSYVLLDANLIYTLGKGVELMLAGQRLLEESRLQYASEYVTPATEIERAVYAKLTWRF